MSLSHPSAHRLSLFLLIAVALPWPAPGAAAQPPSPTPEPAPLVSPGAHDAGTSAPALGPEGEWVVTGFDAFGEGLVSGPPA